MRSSIIGFACAMAFAAAASSAHAEVAVAIKGSTLGVGGDLNFGLTEKLNLRVGYSAFDFTHGVDRTDVRYNGTLKLSNISGVFDLYPWSGAFRMSLGAVATDNKVNATGRPTDGSYKLNGNVYSASEVGSLRGEIKMGNSIAPYVGIGWGNPVGEGSPVTVLFDVGAIYTGKTDVTLTAQCGAALSASTCTRLQNDTAAEARRLRNDVNEFTWYPVISLGLAYRF
jgi:hypothetical protein